MPGGQTSNESLRLRSRVVKGEIDF